VREAIRAAALGIGDAAKVVQSRQVLQHLVEARR
jgi:hypothetical protein